MNATPREDRKRRAQQVWDRQAAHFDRQMGFWEGVLFEGDREWACSQARGDVLEVAVGTGRNLSHYPPGVRITGIDLSPAMLAHARRRAQEIRADAQLREADAEELPFDDASFDTVVCTYSLCSIPDPQQALKEIARVLRPGGSLILAEHVASPNRYVRAVQWLMHQVTYRLALEHMLRRPQVMVAVADLRPVHTKRRKAGIVLRMLAQKQPDAGIHDPGRSVVPSRRTLV